MGMRATITITALLFAACSRRHPSPHMPPEIVEYHRDAWQRFERAAAAFSTGDGVDKSEAEFLAHAFFVWKISGCGFADTVEDGGSDWNSRPRIGFSGSPGNDLIRINKKTGVLSYGSETPMPARDLIQHEKERLRENLRTFVGEPPVGR